MNTVSGSPVALGAPLALGGAPPAMAPAVSKWRPAPHRWTPRNTRMAGRARMGQYGPLGIEFPLISLAVDVGAGAVAYTMLRKMKPKGAMLYITWGVLVLSGLRAINDAAKLVALILPPRG